MRASLTGGIPKRIGAYALNAEIVAAKDAAGLGAALLVDCVGLHPAATTRTSWIAVPAMPRAQVRGLGMRAALAVRCVGGACRRLAPNADTVAKPY